MFLNIEYKKYTISQRTGYAKDKTQQIQNIPLSKHPIKRIGHELSTAYFPISSIEI